MVKQKKKVVFKRNSMSNKQSQQSQKVTMTNPEQLLLTENSDQLEDSLSV